MSDQENHSTAIILIRHTEGLEAEKDAIKETILSLRNMQNIDQNRTNLSSWLEKCSVLKKLYIFNLIWLFSP